MAEKKIFMWKAEHEMKFKDVTAKAIWSAWVDINNWPKWDAELEETNMTGSFEVGTCFKLRPKGGPNVNIEIIEVSPFRSFTDVTRFPLAKIYDYHEVRETDDGVILKSEISITGPLGWLWKRIVAQGVAAGTPEQMVALVAYAKKHQG